MPRKRAMDEIPGSLKRVFIKGEKSLLKRWGRADFVIRSEMIRKGRREGRMMVVQSVNADFVALIMS